MSASEEKKRFGERLRQVLSQQGAPTNKPTWLSREFNQRYSGTPVTVQTANNWLQGTAIPAQDKLQVLGAWLQVSVQWLRFGEAIHAPESCLPMAPYIVQRELTDFPERFSKLTSRQKMAISQVVDAILADESKLTHQ